MLNLCYRRGNGVAVDRSSHRVEVNDIHCFVIKNTVNGFEVGVILVNVDCFELFKLRGPCISGVED